MSKIASAFLAAMELPPDTPIATGVTEDEWARAVGAWLVREFAWSFLHLANVPVPSLRGVGEDDMTPSVWHNGAMPKLDRALEELVPWPCGMKQDPDIEHLKEALEEVSTVAWIAAVTAEMVMVRAVATRIHNLLQQTRNFARVSVQAKREGRDLMRRLKEGAKLLVSPH